ncbi:MAG: glycosyltransferase [Erysipelotrichales bacterium]|nr:glycosyltransferase [Erysipelotrichales bacterium]
MKKKLVTVAVAVYNAEKYLDKCLTSILNQSYSNLQIILVDDGSTDNSNQICKKYEMIDERVVLFTKENGGLCSARNLVLEKMKGDYLMFIDNDDWVDYDIVEFLLNKCEEYQLDFSSCSSIDHFENDNKIIIRKRFGDKIFDKNEGIHDFYSLKNFTFDAIQIKLYKVELFTKYRFKIGRTTDDTLATPRIMDLANRMGYFDVPKYHYLERIGSMCRTQYNEHSIDNLLAYIDNYELIETKYPDTLKDIQSCIFSTAATNFIKLKVLGLTEIYSEHFQIYKECMKKYKPIKRGDKIFLNIFYIVSKNELVLNISIFLLKSNIKKMLNIIE